MKIMGVKIDKKLEVISTEEAENLESSGFVTPCLFCAGLVLVQEQEDGSFIWECETEGCKINKLE